MVHNELRLIALLGGLLSEGQSGYQRRELIDERFEKSSRILIGDYPVRIHQAGLKGDVGFPSHDKDTQDSKNLSAGATAPRPL